MMVQTEIGLLPEDWEVVQIGNVGKVITGSTPPTVDEMNYGHEFMFVSPADLGLTKYINKTITYLSKMGFSISRQLPEGAILYTCIGSTIGKIGIAGNMLATNQQINAIVPFASYNNEYVYYALQIRKQHIIGDACVQAVPLINKSDFSEKLISIPLSSTEQQNIASALSSIDKLIDDLGRTIQKKQRIREGAMEELLSGKRRLPGFTEEWVEKKIGDIGKTYSGLTGKTKEDFGHGDAKYITFLNVLNNAILDISIFEAVDVRPNEKQNAAHYGDLFFNTSSETPEDVGTCACLNTEVPNLYLNSFCFGYRLNDEEVYGNFLAYFFRTKAGRDIMYSLAQGATRYNLSKEYFNEIKITMPPTIKEQQSISYVFEAMTDEISLLESERAKYEQIHSGMMEELLTGKKRLK